MDSLTHIVLGACIGEWYAGKSLGKKALVIGAVAQSLPDIDFIASFWLSPANDLLAHRGFTHSFLFVLLTAYPLALILSRWRWVPFFSLRQMTIFLTLELMVHLILDAFNAYGTAWFEPFSHYRVSFHTLFVADPLFSIGIGIAALVLFIAPNSYVYRRRWAVVAIILSVGYLFFGLMNKAIVQGYVKESLSSQQISYNRYFTTTTPGNVFLWYIVVESETGYHIGYRSIFDKQKTIPFEFFERNDAALHDVGNQEDLQHLLRFAEGYYIVTQFEDKLVFNDLRFGQMLGWQEPRAPFVFYYYLEHPNDNELLIQRGRFARWNSAAFMSFLKRIRGV